MLQRRSEYHYDEGARSGLRPSAWREERDELSELVARIENLAMREHSESRELLLVMQSGIAAVLAGHQARALERFTTAQLLAGSFGVEAAAEPDAGASAEETQLTQRELEVLLLLAQELSRAEMAESLFVSVNTVKFHVKGIYRKLGVDSRKEAVRQARSAGLIRS